MDFKPDFMGYNFTWFIGEVEEREDPLKVGRVKVRCFGWHSRDKEELPTKDLPWAQTIQPVTAPAAAPSGLTVGIWVFGFFMDGDKAQRPMIMGQIPGYRYNEDGTGESELPKAARVEYDSTKAESLKADLEENSKKTFDPQEVEDGGRTQGQQEADIKQEKEQIEAQIKTNNNLESPQSKLRRQSRVTGITRNPQAEEGSPDSTWDEPEELDDKKYPYVQTVASESGFITETIHQVKEAQKDDSFVGPMPSVIEARQVSYDCSGGYEERRSPSGDKITKVIGDNYEIVCGSSFVNIKGDVNLTVDGSMRTTVTKDYELNVTGNMYTVVGGTDSKYVLKNQSLGIMGTRSTKIGGFSTSASAVADSRIIVTRGASDVIMAGARTTSTVGPVTENTTGAYTNTVTGPRTITTVGVLTETASTHVVTLGSGTFTTGGAITSTSMFTPTLKSNLVSTVNIMTHRHAETGVNTLIPIA